MTGSAIYSRDIAAVGIGSRERPRRLDGQEHDAITRFEARLEAKHPPPGLANNGVARLT